MVHLVRLWQRSWLDEQTRPVLVACDPCETSKILLSVSTRSLGIAQVTFKL
jgi:hypothetical protein